jgi:hypothetical protein
MPSEGPSCYGLCYLLEIWHEALRAFTLHSESPPGVTRQQLARSCSDVGKRMSGPL